MIELQRAIDFVFCRSPGWFEAEEESLEAVYAKARSLADPVDDLADPVGDCNETRYQQPLFDGPALIRFMIGSISMRVQNMLGHR